MSRKPPPEAPDLRALSTLTARGREAVSRPSPAELDRGLARLLSRIAAHRSRRAKAVRTALVALSAVVCTLLAIQIVPALRERLRGPSALGYRIVGGSVLEGGYLRDSGAGGVRLF